MSDNVFDFSSRQIGLPTRGADTSPQGLETGGGGYDPPGMDHRLSKLEAAVAGIEKEVARFGATVEGLRHSQNLTVGATVGLGSLLVAVIVGFGIYGLQRVDMVDAKVNALPGQISDGIRDANRSFSDALNTSLRVFKQAQREPEQPAPNKDPLPK